MSDLNRLADLLLPGIRNAQLKLEEVSNYLSVMPNSLRQYNGWQPIETAPKDGQNVLVYNKYGIQIGCWSVVQPEWCYQDTYLPMRQPTHWMPLPEPPK